MLVTIMLLTDVDGHGGRGCAHHERSGGPPPQHAGCVRRSIHESSPPPQAPVVPLRLGAAAAPPAAAAAAAASSAQPLQLSFFLWCFTAAASAAFPTAFAFPGGDSEKPIPPTMISSEHSSPWVERHSFGSTEQNNSELRSETVAPRQLNTIAAPAPADDCTAYGCHRSAGRRRRRGNHSIPRRSGAVPSALSRLLPRKAP